MEITLTLALPRDSMSIPVVRRVLSQSMRTLGVADECTSDVELAITEACTNVLDHAVDGDDYEVSARVSGSRCVIEVIDRGAGFDATMHGLADAAIDAEEGRGIQLMRALMDRMRFENRPSGTTVYLEKELIVHDGAPLRVLSDSAPA